MKINKPYDICVVYSVTIYELLDFDMKNIKLIIEKHADGFTGYPVGFRNGAILGQGETYQEALSDTKGAIQAFIEYYGMEKFLSHFDMEFPILDAFVEETGLVQ
jgi:hypothetical protein